MPNCWAIFSISVQTRLGKWSVHSVGLTTISLKSLFSFCIGVYTDPALDAPHVIQPASPYMHFLLWPVFTRWVILPGGYNLADLASPRLERLSSCMDSKILSWRSNSDSGTSSRAYSMSSFCWIRKSRSPNSKSLQIPCQKMRLAISYFDNLTLEIKWRTSSRRLWRTHK